MHRTLRLALLAAGAFVLYAARLDVAPVHLQLDEAAAGVEARSIATTAHDSEGRLLPLYFHVRDTTWFQPLLVYPMSLVLRLSTFSERALRLPSAAVGTLDVVLMFLLARRLFSSDRLGFVASILLALTPAHFLYSRLAMDYLYPVPFVMAWLLALTIFLEEKRPWLLGIATACLGLGFYSQATSVLMMPLYVLLTCLALWLEGSVRPRLYGIALAGFVLPLLLLVPWFLQHPGTYLDTVGRWGVHPAYLRNPLDGLRALFNWGPLGGRVSLFWDFFNPSYLFFTGTSRIVGSAHHAGVFLLPVALFLPVGLWQLARLERSRTMSLVLLLGFATAPLVASTLDQPQAIRYELVLLPFAVLIATIGVEQLLVRRGGPWAVVGLCALVLVPIQFSNFYRDYFAASRASAIATGRNGRQSVANERRVAANGPRGVEAWDVISAFRRAPRGAVRGQDPQRFIVPSNINAVDTRQMMRCRQAR